jgi:hypothetical protein
MNKKKVTYLHKLDYSISCFLEKMLVFSTPTHKLGSQDPTRRLFNIRIRVPFTHSVFLFYLEFIE